MKLIALALLVMAALSACTTNSDESEASANSGSALCAPRLEGSYLTDKKAPRFKGLDYFNFPVTTSSSEAQAYFNQGWAWAAGFNHMEAARSFYWATREDPACAMCYWGLAYVLGPIYNMGMDPEVFADAVEATQQAKLLSANCSERERDLINAMAVRYPANMNEEREEHDEAYAAALGKLHEKYPDDHDIAVLYAEALMDLHPWDLWEKTGEPKPWTPQILDVLKSVSATDPENAIANHLYIHAVEASHTPQTGNKAASLLADKVPGSGHLVHMPSHIYIRTGEYHSCSEANLKAVYVDSNYVDACHAAGVYPLAYYPHNFHFICACAAMEGSGDLALEASYRMKEKLDTQAMRMPGLETIQHYYSIPYYIMAKFHRWDDILAAEMPSDDLVYPRAILHYTRGLAYIGKDDPATAAKEQTALRRLKADSSIQEFTIWGINSATELLDIADLVLAGEILMQKGQSAAAIESFEKAVAIEDGLNYNEPPDWFFSVRHYLGNALLETGNWQRAQTIFEEDLFNFPKNGWALSGLYTALKGQNKNREADAIKVQFDESWQWADVRLKGSEVL